MLDREWSYTYINRAAERIAGLRREEMLGRTVREVSRTCSESRGGMAAAGLKGRCRTNARAAKRTLYSLKRAFVIRDTRLSFTP